MLSGFVMSKRGSQALWLLGVLLLGIGHGWAQVTQPQPRPSSSDPFEAYHNSLASTADRLLAVDPEHLPEALQDKHTDHAAVPNVAAGNSYRRTRPANRMQQLRPALERILREERVPPELAAVVLIESGGKSTALSLKGARGIWQFMPDTARRYGLAVTLEHDERLDVQKSTRAAARYLRDLHMHFGDWRLAFAAYNAGEDRVQRAVERNHTSDFSQLSSRRSLPLETRQYVPAVIDAIRMFGNGTSTVLPTHNAAFTWVVFAEAQPGKGGDDAKSH